MAYPGFESDEFEEHLYGEDRSEDHVEDVHHIVEGRWLPIVLARQDGGGLTLCYYETYLYFVIIASMTKV